MDATRQLYIGLVSEPGAATSRYLRYLTGERKGQIKTFPYRGGVIKEADRSYNGLSRQGCVAVLPILPHINLEDLKDA